MDPFGLSPKTISISAAVSAPMPMASRRVGGVAAGEVVEDQVVLTDLGLQCLESPGTSQAVAGPVANPWLTQTPTYYDGEPVIRTLGH